MSGKITRAIVEAIDPSHLADQARVLRSQASKYEPLQTQFAQRLRYPDGGEEFTGQASDALQAKSHSAGNTFGALTGKLNDTARVFGQASESIGHAASTVRGEITEIEAEPIDLGVAGRRWNCGEPFVVTDDLAVQVKPGAIPQGAPEQVGSVLAALAVQRGQKLAPLVQQLSEVSDDWGAKIKTALDLAALGRDPKGQPYTPYDPNNTVAQQAAAIANGTMDIPANPYILRHLWQQLDKDQKNAIYERHHDIGNHGGIPFDPPDHLGRDHYNQQHLGELKQQKQTEIDKARAEHPDWAAGHPPPPLSGRFESQERMAWKRWQDRINALGVFPSPRTLVLPG